jgi:restriction endonuclease Mrr
MKNKTSQLGRMLADYKDRGWLDLDRVLEALELGTKSDHQREPILGETNYSSEPEVVQKIEALLDLYEVPEEKRRHILQHGLTDAQLEKLHREWLEKVKRELGTTETPPDRVSGGVSWQDYSVYRSGSRPGSRPEVVGVF